MSLAIDSASLITWSAVVVTPPAPHQQTWLPDVPVGTPSLVGLPWAQSTPHLPDAGLSLEEKNMQMEERKHQAEMQVKLQLEREKMQLEREKLQAQMLMEERKLVAETDRTRLEISGGKYQVGTEGET